MSAQMIAFCYATRSKLVCGLLRRPTTRPLLVEQLILILFNHRAPAVKQQSVSHSSLHFYFQKGLFSKVWSRFHSFPTTSHVPQPIRDHCYRSPCPEIRFQPKPAKELLVPAEHITASFKWDSILRLMIVELRKNHLAKADLDL